MVIDNRRPIMPVELLPTLDNGYKKAFRKFPSLFAECKRSPAKSCARMTIGSKVVYERAFLGIRKHIASNTYVN